MVLVSLIFALSAFARAHAGCDGLLLNAEAFGFGPTAAIRQIAPDLRASHARLGYLGSGHTLELQRGFAYDTVREVPTRAEDAAVLAELRSLRREYRDFFTAIDFRYARLAAEAGFNVGLYDPLFWFWSRVPPEVGALDLYVVQDFVGVDERRREEASKLPRRTVVVPPLTPRLRSLGVRDRDPHVLVNLGGLDNPFLPSDLARRYAEVLAGLCEDVTASRFERRSSTAKPRLADQIESFDRLVPADVQRLLERVRVALMTPGLGTLFEASAARTPVVWLPPANDSQGQQVALLERRGLIDARLGWGEITGLAPVDYFQPQARVMAEIARRMERLISSNVVRDRFRRLLSERIDGLMQKQDHLALPLLVRQTGADGGRDLARIITLWTHAPRGHRDER